MSNRFIMELLSFYILIRFVTESMASIESGQRSLVILAGKKTTISCNPGPEIIGIDWYFVVVGDTEEIKLSTRSQIFSAAKDVSVSGKIPGESISINSTEFKHAGKYICVTLIRQENRSRAEVARFITQVIVLESDPECHLNTATVKEGDNIEMRCIVRYSGNCSPVMEWKDINGNIITNGVLTESTNDSLTSMLNVSADASEHNSLYVCITYFTAHPNQSIRDIANSIPDYNYTWTSPLVQVFYGPKEVFLSPRKEFYSVGDEVICTAQSSPISRFKWNILENSETFDGPDGPVLVIRSEMIRSDRTTIQCEAINDATALHAKSRIVKITPVIRPTIKIVTSILAFVCAVLVFMVLVVLQRNIKEWVAKVCRRQLAEEREAHADVVPLEVNENEPLQTGIIRNQAYPPSCAEIADCAFASAAEFSNSSACRNIIEKGTMAENSTSVDGSIGETTCKYVEMNASGFKSTVVPPAGPSLFSMSIYASIDHTLKVSPPPPIERHI